MSTGLARDRAVEGGCHDDQLFAATLDTLARERDSLLCVGLDPHASDLPAPTAAAARDFCLRLIEQTADLAIAYKPNAAFFELFGPEGWAALEDVIAAVPAGIPVILDAKRGDIASTAEAYARFRVRATRRDRDHAQPVPGRRQPGAVPRRPGQGRLPALQDLQPRLGRPAGPARWPDGDRCSTRRWRAGRERGTRSGNLGLVVGATHPEALARVRALAPDLWFLAPGVGAQGGDLAAALRAGLRADGLGMLIPVSRAALPRGQPAAGGAAVRRRGACATVIRPSCGAPVGAMQARTGGWQTPVTQANGCACRRAARRRLRQVRQLHAQVRPAVAHLPRPAPAGLAPGAAGRGRPGLRARCCAACVSTAWPRCPTPRCPSARRSAWRAAGR